jgi:hypothetical protein
MSSINVNIELVCCNPFIATILKHWWAEYCQPVDINNSGTAFDDTLSVVYISNWNSMNMARG